MGKAYAERQFLANDKASPLDRSPSRGRGAVDATLDNNPEGYYRSIARLTRVWPLARASTEWTGSPNMRQ
jgi:hypothetical protein